MGKRAYKVFVSLFLSLVIPIHHCPNIVGDRDFLATRLIF